jgi:tetratricopeptide (TPR) repeat protein
MKQALPVRLRRPLLDPSQRLQCPANFPFGMAGLFLPVVFFLLGQGAIAQKTFDFNSNCQAAYKEIVELRLARGEQMLAEEKRQHPDNLIPAFLENYVDFFVLFFNEDPAEYKKRKSGLANRLQLMDEGPRDSPFFLFTKSVMHFQWAAIKIKFDHSWEAGWEFRRSFLQAEEAEKKFPSFLPAGMMLGAMQVAAGTIPDGYKWLSKLLGIKGSIRDGMAKLEKFLSAGDPVSRVFHDEAVFYYLYLKFYIENKKEEVSAYLRQNHLDTKNNHLFAYLAANISLNNQQSAFTEQIIEAKSKDPGYLNLVAWDMELGSARLNHLDSDANGYLEKFVSEFRGKFYLKEVLQKLSWYYYLAGNQDKAAAYRQKILELGSTDTEADKQALKDAKTGRWPNSLLLRARLLNDGGYTKEALDVIQGKSSGDFASAEEKLEFAYRLGRIYDDLGRTDEAIAAYLTTIKLGEQRREYYAARAALQIGYIYEKRSQKQTATAYFQKVIELKDHDYKNSLDQKAKAGIERCKTE